MGTHELSLEQSAIVHHGAGSLVVRAGAGTGKTETLTRRVLHLLTEGAGDEGPCELREVVALTFTEKAAAEMRQRIYQGILAELATATEPAKAARLERLRAEFADDNRIGTFDSFNRRLLVLYPERTHFSPQFEPMTPHDERELHVALSRAWWDVLETDEGRLRETFFELLGYYERGRALELIARLAQEPRPLLARLSVEVSPERYRRELGELVQIALERIGARFARRMLPAWEGYARELPPDLPAELNGLLRDPEMLRYEGCELLTQKHTFAKRRIKPEWKEICAQLEEGALRRLRVWRELDKKRCVALAPLRQWEQGEAADIDWESREIVRRLAVCALWWGERRQAMCREKGWANFSEMQSAAIGLLQDRGVSQKLRQGCRHILIDEFQDTNMAQWQLIESFHADNVLVVGDEKQAIYRFRGGDITVFREVRRRLIQDRPPYELSISRRSTRPIVEFCNRLFAALLPEEEEAEEFEASFQALQAVEGNDGGGVGVWKLGGGLAEENDTDNEGESESTTHERRLALADAVARLLREIQDDADGGPGGFARRREFAAISKRIQTGEPGAVGVLFRTHDRKALFEMALQARGVRYVSVQGVGFFQSQQARDVINLARFLFDSHDDGAVAGLLRSPLVGVSDRVLMELRIGFPRTWLWRGIATVFEEQSVALGDIVASPEDRHALEIAAARLRGWRNAVRVQPFSEVLETILRESEIAFADGLEPDAAQRAENWSKLVAIVRDRESRGQGSLRELVEFLMAQEEEEQKEADAALPDSGSIQLMTIYAAKGLGFPMTIVAQSDDAPVADRDTVKRGAFPTREQIQFCVKVGDDDETDREPVLWRILREEERAQREAEFRRLFYVACTRAKEHLVLAQPAKAKSGSWGEMMAPFWDEIAPIVLGKASALESATDVRDVAASNLNWLRPLPASKAPLEIQVTEIVKLRAAPDEASVSFRWHAIADLGPDSGPNEDSRGGRSGNPRDLGTWLHHLFEFDIDPERDRIRAKNLLSVNDVPEDLIETMLKQTVAIRNWLEYQGIDLSRARREFSFSVPAERMPGKLLSELNGLHWVNGQIDLMAPLAAKITGEIEYGRDVNGEAWAVIDFKSHGSHLDPHVIAHTSGYVRQVRLYAAAAASLGLRVATGYLIFMSESGRVTAIEIDCSGDAGTDAG